MKVGLDSEGIVPRLSGLGVGAFVIGTSWPLVRLGRRLRVEPGDWQTITRDPHPPIVYLRPFVADGVESVGSFRSHVRARPFRRLLGETTYEQRLARALADVAPFVAIANPAEGLPEIGATRLAVADSEWRDRVAELTSGAGSIIVHAGVSDGLSWEIEHVVTLDAPERLIVALPAEAGGKRPSREQRYDRFSTKFNDVFPRGLPRRTGNSQFLFFDADWEAHCFGDRGSAPFRAEPGSAGEQRAQVLERLRSEFRVSAFPFWVRAAAAFPLFVLGLLAVATAVYAFVTALDGFVD